MSIVGILDKSKNWCAAPCSMGPAVDPLSDQIGRAQVLPGRRRVDVGIEIVKVVADVHDAGIRGRAEQTARPGTIGLQQGVALLPARGEGDVGRLVTRAQRGVIALLSVVAVLVRSIAAAELGTLEASTSR